MAFLPRAFGRLTVINLLPEAILVSNQALRQDLCVVRTGNSNMAKTSGVCDR